MYSSIETPAQETIDLLRMFLNDLEDVNRLLRVEELPDEKLSTAIKLAIDEFNTTPPLVYNVNIAEQFPSMAMLMHGASIYCLKMAGLMHLRNQLSYNDGGIQVAINEKEAQYRQWYSDYRNEWRMWVKEWKVSRNYEDSLGEVRSEYSNVWWLT